MTEKPYRLYEFLDHGQNALLLPKNQQHRKVNFAIYMQNINILSLDVPISTPCGSIITVNLKIQSKKTIILSAEVTSIGDSCECSPPTTTSTTTTTTTTITTTTTTITTTTTTTTTPITTTKAQSSFLQIDTLGASARNLNDIASVFHPLQSVFQVRRKGCLSSLII